MNVSLSELAIQEDLNDIDDISSSDIDIEDTIEAVVANLNAYEGKKERKPMYILDMYNIA